MRHSAATSHAVAVRIRLLLALHSKGRRAAHSAARRTSEWAGPGHSSTFCAPLERCDLDADALRLKCHCESTQPNPAFLVGSLAKLRLALQRRYIAGGSTRTHGARAHPESTQELATCANLSTASLWSLSLRPSKRTDEPLPLMQLRTQRAT